MAAALSSDAEAQAADLALRTGSNEADAISFAADLGEDLSFTSPAFMALKAIHEKVEAIREKVQTVKHNREELTALEVRCTYVTACVVVKCRQNPWSEIDLTELENCVEATGEFVERFSRRGKTSRVLKASSDKQEIAELNARLDRIAGDLGLAGIAVLEEKADIMKEMLKNLRKAPVKLANVPKGTPVRKTWHVERRHVMASVFEALTDGTGPRLVGLVGDSGAGKTTAASELVRSTEMREAFSDGIVWLTVNDGATERLPALMMQLARMVHKDIGGNLGHRPTESNDGAAYVKQHMESGHGGKGIQCLVVADNVWEKEVVSKLVETGMSVLLSTRDETLVTGADGVAVRVDELSQADAESVLRRAADLSPEVRLPDDALDLIELCGRVIMDLAFVGRWSMVRGRHDRAAWSAAADKIREEMIKVGCDPRNETAEDTRMKRRKAILKAGLEELGSDDVRLPRLYLSLAVMPDGHAFTSKDAAVLLFDSVPSPEDEASAGGVVDVLERWGIIRSIEGVYRMYDAHSSFARENLMYREDVRLPALRRWARYISSLEFLRSTDSCVLKRVWLAVERVGGDGWAQARPYEAALVAMKDSDPLLRQSVEAMMLFEEVQEDWDAAATTGRLLLNLEERELGADHPSILKSYRRFAVWAERLGNVKDAAKWREKEREALPLVLARVKTQIDSGADDAGDLVSLTATMLDPTAGERDEAEKLLRRMMEILEADLGQADMDEVVSTLYELALRACRAHAMRDRQAGRLKEAEELLRCCLGIEESKLSGGRHDVRLTSTLHELGVCVRQSGKLDEAEGILRRCLGIKEEKLGPEHVLVASTLHELVVCVREAGQLEEARRLEETEELLRRCLDTKKANLASILHHLGVCVREAGRLAEAEDLLRRCLEMKNTKHGPDSLQVVSTLRHLGVCVRQAGRLEEAEETLRRGLAITEDKLDPTDEQVASTLHELAVCVREAGGLEEAEEMLRRCLAIKEAKLGPKDVQVASTLHELAVCVRETGRLEAAEVLLRRCLSVKEARLGPEDVQVASTLHELAVCVREAGRLEDAEALLRRCLSTKETKLGPEDVQVAFTLEELGVVIREAGGLEEAEEMLRRCLAIKEAKLGPEDIQVASTLHEIGMCIREPRRLGEAVELLRRCLHIEEAKLGRDHLRVASTLHWLGSRASEAGRLEEGEELLRRCLAIQVAKLGSESVQVASTLHVLGSCVSEAGRWEEGEELLRRCLAIQEAKLDPQDAQVASTLHELGVCASQAERLDEAEQLLRRCLTIQEAKLGPGDEQVGSTLNELSICVRQAGRLEEAEELTRRWRDIEEGRVGKEEEDNTDAPNTNFPARSEVAEDSIPTVVADETLGTSDCVPLHEVTLAKFLGPKPVVNVSLSHGVELEVQAGSLSHEVHRPVTVSPRLQFVECSTEGSRRAPPHEDGFKEDFLAMTFVHGPEEAIFMEEKPAKLRFFVGYVDEFAPGDGLDEVVDDEGIETYVLETYRPLTSQSGVGDWTVLGHYSVLFRSVSGNREVWVETALQHFCTVANGVQIVTPNIPGYKNEKSSSQPYYKGDIGGLFGALRRKVKGASATPMVRLGNATQACATFTTYPSIEHMKVTKGSDVSAEVGFGGVSAAFGKGEDSSVEGVGLPAGKEPITTIVPAGTYQDCEVPYGLKAHQQMQVKVGFFKHLTDNKGVLQVLDEDRISGNRILVLRPRRLEMPWQFAELSWPCTAEKIMILK